MWVFIRQLYRPLVLLVLRIINVCFEREEALVRSANWQGYFSRIMLDQSFCCVILLKNRRQVFL